MPYEDNNMSWKQANPEAATEAARVIYVITHLGSTKDIDAYASYLEDIVAHIACEREKTMIYNGRRKSWWTEEVCDAIRDYKGARCQGDEGQIREALHRRGCVILRVQTASFRDWSHLPVQLPRVPVLRRADGSFTEDFIEKTKIFRERLYPTAETADLSDTTEVYDDISGPLLRVTLEEIASVMATLPSDKTPGISRVPNCVLQVMDELLVKILFVLTQACLNWEWYHFQDGPDNRVKEAS